MKQTIYLFFALLFAVVLAACDKENDFLRDNTTPTGVGYAPVSTNSLADVTVTPAKTLATSSSTATVYAGGATFKTELQYISQSPVKEINLFNTVGTGTRTRVATIPYAPAYSTSKKVDTLLVPYTVPTVASNTIIKLEYEVLNQNNLNVLRTVYLKVQ